MSTNLFRRTIISFIEQFIDSSDIIVLHGSRQVGKTSIMLYLIEHLNKLNFDTYYIDLEDLRFTKIIDLGAENLLKYLEENSIITNKKLYLFIDEIQYLENPSNFLKIIHDHYSERIKLFISGSSTFAIKSKFKDSLVGRTINFEIFPLSFREHLLFKGSSIDISKKISSPITINEIKNLYAEYILYGGYPRIVLEKEIKKKEILLQQIIDTYIRKDIKDIGEIREIKKFNILLEILASQSGNILNVNELASTTRISRQTIEHYLFLLENTYIIRLVNPYSKNVRSELTKSPKIFFYDSGITSLLWMKTFPNTILGNLFETSVFSELVKTTKKSELYYWRTKDKKEIDFILRKENTLTPIETKLSAIHFKNTAINYFTNNYSCKKSYCISLNIEGEKKGDVEFLYPWEIDSIIAGALCK